MNTVIEGLINIDIEAVHDDEINTETSGSTLSNITEEETEAESYSNISRNTSANTSANTSQNTSTNTSQNSNSNMTTTDTSHDTSQNSKSNMTTTNTSQDTASSESKNIYEDQSKPKSKRKHKQTKWLREIKYYQNTTDLLIPHMNFKRLVQEIIQDYNTDLHVTEEAIEALQTVSEEYLTDYFNCTQDMALHRGQETITTTDMNMIGNILKKMRRE